MNDLISRQAAIVALCKAGCDSGYCGASCDDVKAIEQLPSAQIETHEEHTETHACDLISRQAAIDALGEKPLVWDDLSDFDLGKAAQWSDDVDAIKALPSAQPQRKGRWVGTDYDGYADGNPVYDEWKCSICGCVVEDEEPTWNYCPNCGADMRGEDDET